MENRKLNWTSIQFRKFFNSRWAYIFAFVLYSTLMAIQYTLLATGIMVPRSAWGFGPWYGWFTIGWTSVAGLISVITAVFSARINKKFIIPAVIALSFWVVNSILIKLWFDLIKVLILFIPNIIRWLRWRTGDQKKTKPKHIHLWKYVIGLLTAAGLGVLFGFLVSTHTNWYAGLDSYDAKPYLDGLNIMIGLYAALLVTYGYVEGWFTMIITSALLLAIFSMEGQWSTVATIIFFLPINQGTGLSWLTMVDKKQTA